MDLVTIDGKIKVFCAYDQLVKVSDLVLNPKNTNRHPQDQVELLAKLVAEQGWRQAVVVSKRSGFVTKGEGRIKAASLLNLTTVPVDYQDYDSEQSELADMAADNLVADMAHVDKKALSRLVGELSANVPDFDLTLLGIEQDTVEGILDKLRDDGSADPVVPPAEPAPPTPPETPGGDKARKVSLVFGGEAYGKFKTAVTKVLELRPDLKNEETVVSVALEAYLVTVEENIRRVQV